ncbi:MAG: hypothetical protein F4076_03150 [Acidimicrobiaceae bacterium]|nr:hypothetical protein [Acidimicrobiaceae bacterium]MYE76503.1 hypothetical protein [Acidimicrobiaceae bacterium]MYJ41434.1 hypothetical protein [Acidimicrobiaceae bacterium]
MSITVARTCTEIPAKGNGRLAASDAKPLSAYRSTPAYVLLGDPGAGKTTEFRRECEELEDTAVFVTARNFVADVYSPEELSGRTLFIDGLDEMRAGTADAREPLDEIRRRLVRLGRPNVRISCREADWLGPNDRRSLEEVAPDARITVLLLDELSERATHDLLTEEFGIDNAETFEKEASSRGLAAMLRNPQTLKLLAKAVGPGGAWPESRLTTFELACAKMASEHNDEHRAVASGQAPEAVLDAAGHLCVLLLLCGLEGFRLAPDGTAADLRTDGFVSFDALEEAHCGRPRELLRGALSTKLFKPDCETELVPRHRQIAEFLAGRHLAKLIREGMSARRVVRRMTGPSDGRVVTVLRGLSAWLAAYRGEARRLLIDADPAGVGLYGDLSGFTLEDRALLFRSLVEFAEQGPLFGHAMQDGRADGYRDETARAFRSLASADMLESIRGVLRTPVGQPQRDRTTAFVLEVLSEAEEHEKESLAGLAPDLAEILRDGDRPSWVTVKALDAFTHIASSCSETDQTLLSVLDEIQEGTIADPGDRLRRALLNHLYPRVIEPATLWRDALPRPQDHRLSDLGNFWTRHVLSRSSDEHIASLLDSLCKDAPTFVPALGKAYLDDLPLQLLARALPALGDTLGTERLLDWLDVAGRTHGAPMREDETRSVRQWLESRPQVQKSVFLAWLRRGVATDPDRPYRHWFCDALHRSKLPEDFGLWCLEQATTLENSEPALARELLTQAHASLEDPAVSEGLSPAVMSQRIVGGGLACHLEKLRARRAASRSEDGVQERELEEAREQRRQERRQRQADWAGNLSAELDDLRNNRFFAPNLSTLAKVYLGMFMDFDSDASPRQRIGQLVGGDETLVDAVMVSILGAISRDDLPEADETIALHLKSQHSPLAYPVLASLHLHNEEDPARLDGISRDRKRKALAIHYCVPSDDEFPPWHNRWLQQEPELVLDVLYRCAAPAVRAGHEFVPCLNVLDRLGRCDAPVPVWALDESTELFETRSPAPLLDGHDDLVHATTLRLLEAVPARASNKQMTLLDSLLARAMQHPDRISLRELAARKLSLQSLAVSQRTRWLTVDALLSDHANLGPLKEYVRHNERRVKHLAEFLRRSSHRDNMHQSALAGVREPEVLRDAIEILGASFGPVEWGGGYITLGMEMSELLGVLIEQLGTLAGNDTDRAFRDLIANPWLERWRDRLTMAHERQRVVHRDASYIHPSIEEVQRMLRNEAPTCAADLAALLQDRIADIAAHIRGSNDNPWRNYWKDDRRRPPAEPKHEDSCRDALLADLKSRLPAEVDAAPEGRYAADNRADIRANCSGFNVPIEIKKNSHPDLWTAIRRQLLGKYTTDPATSGYGIYLVLWFAPNATKTPPDGNRPDIPQALRAKLEQELTADEARKISVIVMDVTKPGS